MHGLTIHFSDVLAGVMELEDFNREMSTSDGSEDSDEEDVEQFFSASECVQTNFPKILDEWNNWCAGNNSVDDVTEFFDYNAPNASNAARVAVHYLFPIIADITEVIRGEDGNLGRLRLIHNTLLVDLE
jgi:hypothetical protein